MLDFRNLNPIENAVKDNQVQNSGNCWIFGFALIQLFAVTYSILF